MKEPIVQSVAVKPTLLEKFGLYYLNVFNRKNVTHSVFDISDADLRKRVTRITNKALLFTCIVSVVCVFPTVWIDLYFAQSPMLEHYGWVAIVTIVSVIIELYLLFLIALRAVHDVSVLINMHATQKDFLKEGPFSVLNILSRTALEVPDPELKILGIDPFKRISKKNLFILSLLYKAKIFVTNFILKRLLLYIFGTTVLGIPIEYEALIVECFWNSVVIIRVIHEARLRLFGFALANQIADNVLSDHLLEQLSDKAKIGAMRAIGNAVVMAQNYHPNMIILILRFQELLHITKEHRYDDWKLFLKTLEEVSEKEKNFLLDLFTVAACFDGRISRLEAENLRDAYKEDYELYHPRLLQLAHSLKHGQLHKALDLCKIDFVAG